MQTDVPSSFSDAQILLSAPASTSLTENSVKIREPILSL